MKAVEFRRVLWDLQQLTTDLQEELHATLEPSEVVFELVEKLDGKELELISAKLRRILEEF